MCLLTAAGPQQSPGGTHSMTETRSEPAVVPLDRRSEFACYAAGFFSLGLVPMQAIAIPLWAVELGASPSLLGLAVGMRSLGPFLFAVHGGALADRLGARAVTLWTGAICAVTSLLYPLLPFTATLLLLQFIFGLAQGLAWIGAQTIVGQRTRGQPVYTGRLSSASILGTLTGPVLAGFAWDAGGAPACFGAMALWSCALIASALALPHADPEPAAPPVRAGWSGLLPQPSAYREAFVLLAAPALIFVMLGTFARLGAVAMQGSFYPVYLASIGFDASVAGILLGIAAAVGAPAALLAGAVDRRAPQTWTLVLLIAAAIVALAATPYFRSLWALGALAVLFGAAIGITQPQILSILSRSVDVSRQGLAVGLRTSFNRAASFVVPIAMGAAAEAFGLAMGFLVAGGLLLAVTTAMGALAWRKRLHARV